MKTFLRNLGLGTVLAVALSLDGLAQNEPIIGVNITNIGVASGQGSVIAVELTSGGNGYTTAPTVTVTGGGGIGAQMEAFVTGGAVTGLSIINGGTDYTSNPTITIAPPPVSGASVVAAVSGGQVDILSGSLVGGSGYTSTPAVTIATTDGTTPTTPAVATATIAGGVVTGINFSNRGVGYTSGTTITIAPPVPVPATARVQVVGGLGSLFTQPFQNESYGPVNVPISITALASGTFGTYDYTFFVNGVMLDTISGRAGFPVSASWAPPQPGSYLLTVRAADNDGHSATSLAVRYFATGTAIIGPVDNTLVPNGSSVVLQATATPAPSGPNAFVQRMDFYVDDALVGSDSTYPYSFIYKPAPAPTSHVIEARGFDNNGNQISPNGSATRRLYMVSPIGATPIVRIVNPNNDSSVAAGSSINIIADAVAPDGFIKNVDFYVNGVLLSSTQRFPFTGTWTPQVPGRYEVVAIGFDDKSNAVASAPVVITATGAFPTASIISPESSGYTIVQGTILPVTVRAAGPDGGITSLRSIEFLVDGIVSDSLPKQVPGSQAPAVLTEPFIFNWKSDTAIGTHRLSARVTSATGLSITSTETTVNVVQNQLPRIAISQPAAAGSLTMNAASTLVATASDVDGTIESVEFFVNGTTVGKATKTPFQVSWSPTEVGTFEITAKAIDNGGASATSIPVTITVDPPASSGGSQTLATHTVYRGDYGSIGENGRFAFAVNRNNRGTFIGYSTLPAGRSYLWTDVGINPDGTFVARDANNQVVLTGQTSATGVSGSFSGKTFIGPVTSATGAFTPLQVTGTLTGMPNSQVIAIVGGDGSVTIYSASGTNREVGADFLTSSGNYAFAAPTGGRLSGTVANGASLVSGSVSGAVTGNFLVRQQPSRISNISTRSLAGSGDRTLVAGFVVSGTGTKPLLVRAVGPTLANFGINNALVDPTLDIMRGATLVAYNNDWGNSAALAALATQVGAFALTPGSRDAAVQTSVAPGTYTAVVGGGATAGSALIEIYDAQATGDVTARVTNISTRGQVGAADPMIAGFVITGDVRKKVLIRAVGPTLAGFGLTGLLADPKIEVLSGSAVIASNNDWSESSTFPQVSTISPTVGAFPLTPNSKDAALVLQLSPGAYTVQITGTGNAAGTVLVEIYDADL